MKKLLALAPLAVLLTGCPSFTTMGTAKTLPKGKSQMYVATGAISLADFQQDSATGSYDSFTMPSFEVGGRFGVSERVEVGGKVWPLGAELNAKLGLARADEGGGLSLALAPAGSLYAFSSGDAKGTYVWLHLPVLVGLDLPGGSELTIGPRISDMIVSSGGDTLNVVWLGGSLGFAWKVSDGFRILPELTFAYPASASVGGTSVTNLEPKGGVIQANLGFLFGGD